MLISCKCLNFIATSNSPLLQKSLKVANLATHVDESPVPAMNLAIGHDAQTAEESGAAKVNSLAASLMHAFLHKCTRNFVFYSQCMDLFKQLIGPIPDLAINAINQKDLIYSLTLEFPLNKIDLQSWQISVCINCNTALCAKMIKCEGRSTGQQPPQYLINSVLLTSNDELTKRRSDKAFSETFSLLMMDHSPLPTVNGAKSSASALTPMSMIGSLTTSSSNLSLDPKQQRLRKLQHYLSERLKREIAETDERIQRYTEQQFTLLRSFREKSEQDFELLQTLIQQIPEHQFEELLDRIPPLLEVSNNSSYSVRRRNTIGSRRELTVIPILPKAINSPELSKLTTAIETKVEDGATPFNNTSTIATMERSNSTTINTTASRKLSSFYTPPATPEATPMSVGNSPIFKQLPQQLPLVGQKQLPQPFERMVIRQSLQQQFSIPNAEINEDGLFQKEGMESFQSGFIPAISFNRPQRFQRNPGIHMDKNMSDVEESDDGTEDVEDAIDLDSSMVIPTHHLSHTKEQLSVFGKSLPIDITKPARFTFGIELKHEDLENTVDIAASIKALAKSVHSEAVFGELPRPRLRSQI